VEHVLFGDLADQPADVEEIFIVSDLHLCAGIDPRTGVTDPEEMFRDDEKLVGFLGHPTARAGGGARICLLVLGDFVDLLLVESDFRVRPDTSSARTSARLERIAGGHDSVFRALARLVASGCLLVIVPGNHDIELVRSSAQRRLAELIRASGPLRWREGRVHSVARLRAGSALRRAWSQYQDINTFDAFLEPWLGGDPEAVQLPVGSAATLLGADLRNRSRARRPLDRQGPRGSRRPLGMAYAGPVADLVGTPAERAARNRYRRVAIADFAQQIGLPSPLLQAIDRLAELAPGAIERRAVRELVIARIKGRPAGGARAALRSAARSIHDLLNVEGCSVPFLVFGHTQRPECVHLSVDARYMNTGTWSTFVPGLDAETRPAAQFTTVAIRVSPSVPPTARLSRWSGTELQDVTTSADEPSSAPGSLSSSA